MNPRPDSHDESGILRRATDRVVPARELFKGQHTEGAVEIAFAAAAEDLTADEEAMVRVRAKFASLPPIDK